MRTFFTWLKRFGQKIKMPLDVTMRRLWIIISWLWSILIIGVIINSAGSFLFASNLDFDNTPIGVAWKFLKDGEPSVPSFLRNGLIGFLIGFLILSLGCLAYILLVKKEYESKEVLFLHNITFYLKAISEHLSPSTPPVSPSTDIVEYERLALQRYHHILMESYERQCIGDEQVTFNEQVGAVPASFVSLAHVFVEPGFIADRPIYDTAVVPQDVVKALPAFVPAKKQATTIDLRLQMRWSSQQGIFPPPMLREVTLEKVLQGLSSGSSIAVILGSHGSGKSTLLRKLAWQMAHALATPNTQKLTSTLPFHRTPIFISIAEYARICEKNELTIYDYIANTLDDLYPDLGGVVLKELGAGRCLLLFDDLDALQIVDTTRRQRIIDALQRFIVSQTVNVDARPGKQQNYALLASQIVLYPQLTRAAFMSYPHYTLQPLKDADLKTYITNYTEALTLAQSQAAHIGPTFTKEEQEQSKQVADQVATQLLDLFQRHPTLQQLAYNPSILLRIIASQLNKITLTDRLFSFYQYVCDTLSSRLPFLPVTSSPLAEEQLLEQLLGLVACELYKNATATISYKQISECYRSITVSSVKNGQQQLDRLLNMARMRELFMLGEKQQFCFSYAAFQIYYATDSLLQAIPNERRHEIEKYQNETRWQEVFKLMLIEMDPSTPEYKQLELIVSGAPNSAPVLSSN